MDLLRKIATVALAALGLVVGIDQHAIGAERFYVGAQISYSVIEGDFDNVHMLDVKAGTGVGAQLGFQATPHISLEADWAVTKHSAEGVTIDMSELSLSGRYSFMVDRAVRPYLIGGYGSYTVGDESLTLGGQGFHVGVGFDHFINPSISWGAGLVRRFITYDEITKSDGPVTLVGSLDGQTTSVKLDVKYHF